ncbi:MAG: His/Gly/Thr/Pro-type tRNA ligase C-terminal domain-containing protein [Streptosporangiaceae bacterium]
MPACPPPWSLPLEPATFWARTLGSVKRPSRRYERSSSGKLGRQLKWADDQGVRWCLIYGGSEHAAGEVTIRDMRTGERTRVPVDRVDDYVSRLAST